MRCEPIILPHHWCATSCGTIRSEKKTCSRALRIAAGRACESRYAKVERYSRPGNPCPNVPGMGATVNVFMTGGPNRPLKNSSEAATSLATARNLARGSGGTTSGGADCGVRGKRERDSPGGSGLNPGNEGIVTGCKDASRLRFPYTSKLTPTAVPVTFSDRKR